jgi:hypothetical protein
MSAVLEVAVAVAAVPSAGAAAIPVARHVTTRRARARHTRTLARIALLEAQLGLDRPEPEGYGPNVETLAYFTDDGWTESAELRAGGWIAYWRGMRP